MKTITSCLLVCSLALLSACAGDSNSSMKKSGVVILDEAPVARALICIDVDRSLSCDDGEPSAITNDDGAFELRFPRRYSDRDFVVDGFADEEAEVAFATRATKSTTDPVRFFLTANQSSKTVSPLTTLVAVRARLLGGTAEALAIAQAEVLTMIGLPTSTDLNNFDYVAQNNVKVMAISAAIADVFAASRDAILSQDPGANPVAVLALSVSDLFTTPEGNQSRLGSIANAINYAPQGTDLALLVTQLVLNNTIPADDVQGKLQDVETRIGLIDGRYLPIEDGSIVLDVVTGLEWQRCSVGQTWNAQTSTCDNVPSEHSWDEAYTLTAAGGFVLPTIQQLQTLLDCSIPSGLVDDVQCGRGSSRPTINQRAFPATYAHEFWSASPYLTPDRARTVHFYYGTVRTSPKGQAAKVRLVREQSINQFTLEFDSAGGSAVNPIVQNFASAVTAPADPTRAGYTFAGWNPPVPATMPALNQTFIALWTVPLPIDGRYLIIEDGSIVHDVVTGLEWQRCSVGQTWNAQTSNCDSAPSDYSWNEAYALTAAGGFVLPTKEQLRTLVYCSDTQQYDSNGNDDPCGSGSASPAINQQAFPATMATWYWSASLYEDLDRAWAVNSSSGSVNSRSLLGGPEKVRLVRVGQSISQYTLSFDSAGGSAIAPITQQADTAVTAPAAPTRVGYTFAGWSPALPETMPAENLAFTAQWTINQYTLTFDSAGGSAVDPIAQNFATAVTAPAAPTRVGHTFAGWSPVVPATMPAENQILTALWNQNLYLPVFDSAGGSPTDPQVNRPFGAPLAPPPDEPTRDGYTFAGWSPPVPETMPAENAIYTAQWTLMQYSLAYTAAAGGSLSGNPEQTVSHGQSGSEVIAVANFGYSFQQWTDGATSASRTDTNVTAAATYTANFVLNAAAPGGVVAVAGDESVTVSWAPVAGASSYNLYRSQDTGFDVANYAASTGGALVVGVTSPYQATFLANGTTYYFRVTAVSASGEGLPSVQVAATPEAEVNEGLTRVCVNGEAEGEGSCPADPMVGSSDADWGCTRDGATGLMWAVNSFNNVFFGDGSTDDRYFWFNDGAGAIPNGGVEGYSGDTASCNNVYFWMFDLCNSQNYTSYVNTNGGVCGSTQWRLPTRAELLTLWGESEPLSFTIDDNYFPNFQQSPYLTSETNADNAGEFWTVELVLGQTQTESKAFPGAPQLIWLVSDPAP